MKTLIGLLKDAHSEATKEYQKSDNDSTRRIKQHLDAALDEAKVYYAQGLRAKFGGQ